MRRQVLYQVHFGANYAAGKPYSWTTDLETVKRSVAWQLEQLRTDYIDYGFIHCMDESGDWRRYVDNGVLQYLEALKAQGVGRHIGLSTHTPALAREVLDTTRDPQLSDIVLVGYKSGRKRQYRRLPYIRLCFKC